MACLGCLTTIGKNRNVYNKGFPHPNHAFLPRQPWLLESVLWPPTPSRTPFRRPTIPSCLSMNPLSPLPSSNHVRPSSPTAPLPLPPIHPFGIHTLSRPPMTRECSSRKERSMQKVHLHSTLLKDLDVVLSSSFLSF